MSDPRARVEDLRGVGLFRLLWMLEHGRDVGHGVGEGRPTQEPVRLRGKLSLAFPAADVTLMQEGGRIVAEVAGMTLYGVDAPMPGEHTARLARADTTRARDFLDIFNHRLLGLYYRVWARYRPHTDRNPWGAAGVSRFVADLLGVNGDPAVRASLGVAGLLLHRPRSASALSTALQDVAEADTVVLQGVVRETQLHATQRSALGVRSTTLGMDIVLGARVLDASSGIRVQVGPVTGDRVSEFQPGAARFTRIREVMRVFLDKPLDWDLEVLVDRLDIEPARLSSPGHARLGHTAWLGRPREQVQSIIVTPPQEESCSISI